MSELYQKNRWGISTFYNFQNTIPLVMQPKGLFFNKSSISLIILDKRVLAF